MATTVPAKILPTKNAEYRYRLVRKLECETQCRSEQDDQHDHAAQGTATMVTVAAVELDQVNSRIMGQLVADRYHGLFCMC